MEIAGYLCHRRRSFHQALTGARYYQTNLTSELNGFANAA